MNKTRIYVERNSEAWSCNHRYIGKAIYITYPEGVFIVLGTLHAMRTRDITARSESDGTRLTHGWGSEGERCEWSG